MQASSCRYNKHLMRLIICCLAFICGSSGMASATEASFRLVSDDGKSWITPRDFSGKPVVFLFWDTECAPCLQELKQLGHLRAVFPQAVFVAVSISSRDDTRRVLAKIALPSDVVRARIPNDSKQFFRRLGNREGAVPFSVIFNRNGTLCHNHSGALAPQALLAAASNCT
jgi:thiol-disulfide isomerase/thioredoxin